MTIREGGWTHNGAAGHFFLARGRLLKAPVCHQQELVILHKTGFDDWLSEVNLGLSAEQLSFAGREGLPAMDFN